MIELLSVATQIDILTKELAENEDNVSIIKALEKLSIKLQYISKALVKDIEQLKTKLK
jgi:hypothetical protein